MPKEGAGYPRDWLCWRDAQVRFSLHLLPSSLDPVSSQFHNEHFCVLTLKPEKCTKPLDFCRALRRQESWLWGPPFLPWPITLLFQPLLSKKNLLGGDNEVNSNLEFLFSRKRNRALQAKSQAGEKGHRVSQLGSRSQKHTQQERQGNG